MLQSRKKICDIGLVDVHELVCSAWLCKQSLRNGLSKGFGCNPYLVRVFPWDKCLPWIEEGLASVPIIRMLSWSLSNSDLKSVESLDVMYPDEEVNVRIIREKRNEYGIFDGFGWRGVVSSKSYHFQIFYVKDLTTWVGAHSMKSNVERESFRNFMNDVVFHSLSFGVIGKEATSNNVGHHVFSVFLIQSTNCNLSRKWCCGFDVNVSSGFLLADEEELAIKTIFLAGIPSKSIHGIEDASSFHVYIFLFLQELISVLSMGLIELKHSWLSERVGEVGKIESRIFRVEASNDVQFEWYVGSSVCDYGKVLSVEEFEVGLPCFQLSWRIASREPEGRAVVFHLDWCIFVVVWRGNDDFGAWYEWRPHGEVGGCASAQIEIESVVLVEDGTEGQVCCITIVGYVLDQVLPIIFVQLQSVVMRVMQEDWEPFLPSTNSLSDVNASLWMHKILPSFSVLINREVRPSTGGRGRRTVEPVVGVWSSVFKAGSAKLTVKNRVSASTVFCHQSKCSRDLDILFGAEEEVLGEGGPFVASLRFSRGGASYSKLLIVAPNSWDLEEDDIWGALDRSDLCSDPCALAACGRRSKIGLLGNKRCQLLHANRWFLWTYIRRWRDWMILVDSNSAVHTDTHPQLTFSILFFWTKCWNIPFPPFWTEMPGNARLLFPMVPILSDCL